MDQFSEVVERDMRNTIGVISRRWGVFGRVRDVIKSFIFTY